MKNYLYLNQLCSFQMMSAKATLIGCGYANCGTQGHIFACNYGPP